jgi:hypothetical protein
LSYLLLLPKHIEVRGTIRVPLKMPVLHLPKNRAMIAESMIILGYLKILSTLPEISSAAARMNKGEELTRGEKERIIRLIEQVKESTQSIKQSLWD